MRILCLLFVSFLLISPLNAQDQQEPILTQDTQELITEIKQLKKHLDSMVDAFNEAQQAVVADLSYRLKVLNAILDSLMGE